jgi:hypothetical protein
MSRESTNDATACASKEIEPKQLVAENADSVSIPGASTCTTAGSQDNPSPACGVDAMSTSARHGKILIEYGAVRSELGGHAPAVWVNGHHRGNRGGHGIPVELAMARADRMAREESGRYCGGWDVELRDVGAVDDPWRQWPPPVSPACRDRFGGSP